MQLHQSQLLNDLYNYSSSSQCAQSQQQQQQQQSIKTQPFPSTNNIYHQAVVTPGQELGRQLFHQHNPHQHEDGLKKDHQKHPSTKQISSLARANNDMSLYSPSSSTSLLYHIYDQINLPNEQQHYEIEQNHVRNQHIQHQTSQNPNLPVINKGNNTTVLNPANLFGNPNASNQTLGHSQNPLAMQQSQLNNDLHNYSSMSQYQLHQPFSNTMHRDHNYIQHNNNNNGTFHHHHQSQLSNGANNNLVDNFVGHNSHLVQGNNVNTTPGHNRFIPLLNQRPLSSSGASSTLSAHSIQQHHHQQQQQQIHPNSQLTYGRHIRQSQTNTSRSSSNLASVLQQSGNTLSHLTGFDATGRIVTTINPTGIKPHLFANNMHQSPNQNWKRINKSAKQYFLQYQALFKLIILIALVALTVMTAARYFMPSNNGQVFSVNNGINNVIPIRDNLYIQPSQARPPSFEIVPVSSPSNNIMSTINANNNNNNNNNYNPYDSDVSKQSSSINSFNPNAYFTPQSINKAVVTPPTPIIIPTSTSTTTTTTTSATNNYNQLEIIRQQQFASKCMKCVQNGGQCSPEGRCQCPPGFTGSNCRQLVTSIVQSDPKCQRQNGSSLLDECGQPIERQCSDKIDNDNDGLIDCADSECCSDKACQDSSLCMKSPDPIDILMRKQPTPPTSSFFQRMQFLVSSQSYTTYKDFNDSVPTFSSTDRASVIRGRVTYMRKGMTGVRVSVVGHTSLGMTLSRDGGYFDLMVNGGGSLVMEFRREPFAYHQRAVRVPWNEIILLDPVELVLDNTTSHSVISTPSSTFDQEQSTCFAHNYQSMKPEIVEASRLSIPQNHKSKFNQAPSSSSNQLSSRMIVLKDSGVVQESILIPTGKQDQFLATDSNHTSQSVSLVYVSSRSMEFMSTINLQLVPPSSEQFKLPDELKHIHVKIIIEGNLFEQVFEPVYNLSYTHAWNRRNVYRQKCFGLSNALVSVGYEYVDCRDIIWSTKQIQVPGHDLSISDIGQQWNLNIHHRYNYRDSILQRGDGQNFYLKTDKPKIVNSIIGDGYQRQVSCAFCDGATSVSDQRLLKPQAMVSGPDGSLYVGDFNLIRKIETISQLSSTQSSYQVQERLVRTILEIPESRVPKKYSLALNPAEPSKLYMCDTDSNQIFVIQKNNRQQDDGSVNSTNWDEQLVPIVGTGERCPPNDAFNCGDRQLARLARLVEPKAITFDLSGRMYIADGRNIRMVDLDQKIYTILGDYGRQESDLPNFHCRGDAISMHKFSPGNPVDLDINPIDDTLHILDNNVVYRLTQDKRVHIVAGRLPHCAGSSHARLDSKRNLGVNDQPIGQATGIYLQSATAIKFSQNGELFVSENDQERGIARVLLVNTNDDTISLYAGLPQTNDRYNHISGLPRQRALYEPTFDSLYTPSSDGVRSDYNSKVSESTQRSSNFLSSPSSSRAIDYKFNSISGISVDQQGKLLIADHLQMRILSIEPDLPQIDQAGEYEIQCPGNNDEVLVFNRYGHHIATKDMSLGSNIRNNPYKFTFKYSVNSTFGQLSSIQYANGNKISLYRDGPQHTVKTIESSYGPKLRIESGKQINTIAIDLPTGNKINFSYHDGGGLLKQIQDIANHEIFDLQYDDFGRVSALQHSNPKLYSMADPVECSLNPQDSNLGNINHHHLQAILFHQQNNQMVALANKLQANSNQLCSSVIVAG